VPLKGFCCKARGGGGRLRHATGRIKKGNVRWVLAVIKAKAVAVASAWPLSLLHGVMLYILTIIPDCEKPDCEDSRLLRHYRMVH